MLENELERSDKLDILIRLVAALGLSGKPQREQIRLLSVAGMGPKQISDLIGTTPNTVNVALSSLRKNKRLNLKGEGGKDDA